MTIPRTPRLPRRGFCRRQGHPQTATSNISRCDDDLAPLAGIGGLIHVSDEVEGVVRLNSRVNHHRRARAAHLLYVVVVVRVYETGGEAQGNCNENISQGERKKQGFDTNISATFTLIGDNRRWPPRVSPARGGCKPVNVARELVSSRWGGVLFYFPHESGDRFSHTARPRKDNRTQHIEQCSPVSLTRGHRCTSDENNTKLTSVVTS